MNDDLDLTGEKSNHKCVAVFDHHEDANDQRERLIDELSIDAGQLQLVQPRTRRPGRKLLPESSGIWDTMLRSHLIMGLAGALAGTTVFLGLLAGGIQPIVSNPFSAGFAFIHVGTLFGLMIGGLLTLRPDQVPYIRGAMRALRCGQTVLVVHARSAQQLSTAKALLQRPATGLTSTA